MFVHFNAWVKRVCKPRRLQKQTRRPSERCWGAFLPLLFLELLQEIFLHPLHRLTQTRLHLVELGHHQAQLAQHVVQVVVHLRHPVAGEDDNL